MTELIINFYSVEFLWFNFESFRSIAASIREPKSENVKCDRLKLRVTKKNSKLLK